MFALTSDMSLKEKVAEAIAYIRLHEPPEGYYVGFSGGKDSIVTLDLVRLAGVQYRSFYNMTLIDPPEIVRFIKEHYPDVVRLKPDMTFWQGILKKGMPLGSKRWCCDVLKHGTKSSKEIKLNHRIFGLRAEESAKRALQGRENDFKEQTSYKPIFHWTEGDIWDYIEERNLVYPSLYDEGFSRIGCCVCPFIASKGMLKRNKERWPQFYILLDKYMRLHWKKKHEVYNKKGFTFEMFMTWPLWPKEKERDFLNRQGDMFPEEDDDGKG